MTSKLRNDIRRYEASNETKIRCKLSQIRCLRCPLSAIGCPGAKRWLRSSGRA
jgi:hypothetical protein